MGANMNYYKQGVGVALAVGLLSVSANAEIKVENKKVGYEIGVEQQLEFEAVDDTKFVKRTLGRYLSTVRADVYRNDRGDNLDVEAKAGLVLGHYKGSEYGVDEPYGSLVRGDIGAIAEITALYHISNKSVRPFVGIDAKVEGIIGPRIDMQTDALIGANYKISDVHEVGIEYHKALARKVAYLNKGWTYTQDDVFGVAVYGTKNRVSGKGSDTIRIEWEKLAESDAHYFSNSDGSYEPLGHNVLLSYKRTF